MKIVESLLMFVFLVYFASCIDQSLVDVSEDEMAQEESVGYANVDEALWTHFRAFETAAADYGYTINLEDHNLVGHIESINDGNVVGTCSYTNGRNPNREVIVDSDFWRSASQLYREYIVFHELGHCILGRDHEEACLTNQTWSSIMRSGLGSCRDNYRTSTRDYYIDELFSNIARP